MAGVWVILLAAWLGLLLSRPAAAHQGSDAYLWWHDEGTRAELRWDIALRDLALVVPLDADGDGRITAGEVQQQAAAIDALALRALTVEGCTLAPAGHGYEERSDGVYAALRFAAACDGPGPRQLRYWLLREADPTHRGLLTLGAPAQGTGASPVVLDPTRDAPVLLTTGDGVASATGDGGDFIAEGVHHIVTGYDHVLFLLCLLLPSVMRRTPEGWRPVDRPGAALWPIVGIVSAFTLAHSITLALAASGLASLPSSFIEPAIAATIVLAAIDNLRPLFGGRRGRVTFLFGLVHGFGFAGVLAELHLPPAAFAWALLRFNLGLELGQLAIVAVVVAMLYGLRRWPAYPRWVIGAGSTAAIAVGVLWFTERTIGWSVWPV